MTSVNLVDDGIHLVVRTAEPLIVEQISFDWAVTLHLLGAAEAFSVRLECEFYIATRSDNPLTVSPPVQPEQPAGAMAVLSLWRNTVADIHTLPPMPVWRT